MASDIVPIELGLPQGDLVTLWAPKWREDGEEWEAFLGDEDDLYVFPDAAHLAAFVRTVPEHDLTDHPSWHMMSGLAASELVPDEDHSYDLVGVPELVADDPDAWTINELDEIIRMVRSIAEVCELEKTEEVLNASPGFALLRQGTLPFTGKDGQRVWDDVCEIVAQRWDDVLDEIDGVTAIPEVDGAAVTKAEEELAAFSAEVNDDEDEEGGERALVGVDADDIDADETDDADAAVAADEEDDEPVGFWAEVGIDPVKIVTSDGEFYTLRCYLDDTPLFLGEDGKIDVFGSAAALRKHVAAGEATGEITSVATWEEVAAKATGDELEIEVDEENNYVLTGIAEDIAEGPDAVDPNQLDLAVELIGDAAQWADDDSVDLALAPSESLGWLVSFVLRPDPTRLAPSEPYTEEQNTWRSLVEEFEDRLQKR